MEYNSQTVEVSVYMEKGAYERLVERAQELGVPLSAVIRDAIAKYFESVPEAPESDTLPDPADPIWQLPSLGEKYGALSVHYMGRGGH